MVDDYTRLRTGHAPDTLPRPEDWGAEAVCRDASGVAWAVFFPEDFSGAAALSAAEEAKAYCRRCPVTAACLSHALTRNEKFGVWGGATAAERRAALRRAQKQGAADGTARAS